MRILIVTLLLAGCAGSQFRGESPDSAMCSYSGYVQCIGGYTGPPIGPDPRGTFDDPRP